ncbi:MAG: phosphohydrolase [Sulfobacillus thermosulfidooxidans]|nr:MAG: phosphohydrolase [Sulfobacillus thermosulfidooxidans]
MSTYHDRFAQLTRHRQEHSLRVAALMEDLASAGGFPRDQAFLAGYAHDLARELSRAALLEEALRLGVTIGPAEQQEPVLLHGPIAAAWLQAEGIGTPSVWEAIRYHTTAAPGQDLLGQALFVADGVEPGRHYPARASIEETVRRSIPLGYQAMLEETLGYLKERGLTPHPLMVQAVKSLSDSPD